MAAVAASTACNMIMLAWCAQTYEQFQVWLHLLYKPSSPASRCYRIAPAKW